jgi:hypothetical protein
MQRSKELPAKKFEKVLDKPWRRFYNSSQQTDEREEYPVAKLQESRGW